MDTFTTKPGSTTGLYTDSIEPSATGPISTDGVVINARGDIAGTYADSTFGHAFVTSAAGVTTTFDGAADAQSTSVIGIDTAGEVFGTSYVNGQNLSYNGYNGHGYVYRDGAATVVEPTGASGSSITVVNAAGTVGGFYYDAQNNQHAFVGTSGALSTFDVADANEPAPTAIDAAGDVAGTASSLSGYTYDRVIFFKPVNGDVVSTTVPDGYYNARVTGVNSAGEVVGTYRPTDYTNNTTIGFTYTQAGGFKTVPLPTQGGAVVSVAGLDALGNVAGTYKDSGGTRHGFIDSALGVSTAVDGPAGSTGTEVTSIDAAGTVFGDYTNAAGQQHAFFQRIGGTFTAVPDAPGALNGVATGEDAAGDVVGSYYTYGGQYGYDDPSFIDRAGTTTQITVPGQPEVAFSSVDAAGRLIGTVSDADGTHAFVDANGTVTTFDSAVGAQATTPVGADANGDIAGSYVDASGTRHGFLRQGTTVSTIDPSGSTSTTVSAINAAGVVAGTYYDGKAAHGFVDVGGKISTFDSPNGISSYASVRGVDAAGDVLASFNVDQGSYLRDAATGTVTKVAVAGTSSTYAQGIDAAGDVFGSYRDANGQHGFVQGATGGATITVNGPAGSNSALVSAVDAAGNAFGTYEDSANNSYLFELKAGATVVTTFNLPAGARSASIVGIDAVGDIAANFYLVDANGYHPSALVEIGGTVTQVNGSADATLTQITGIDTAGDVYGYYQDTAGQHDFASFAADMPTIAGTHASSTTGEAAVSPFGGVTVGGGQNRTASLTITLSGAGGTLRDGAGYAGLAQNTNGSYALSGTAAAVTAELDALAFTPAAAGTTTFTLTDTSGIGGTVTGTATDMNTAVTDTAVGSTNPGSGSTNPGSGSTNPGGTSTNPGGDSTNPGQPVSAGTVSFDDQVFYDQGVFTLTGRVSGTAGLSMVEITASVDGTATDLGAATVNADSTFTFRDVIGAHTQGFITATATDAGGTASGSAGYALMGGLSEGKVRAEQDRYSTDGSNVTATDLFKANGSQTANLFASSQTFGSAFFDTFENGGAPLSTFVLNPGFGRDTVDLFRVDGADHNTLSFRGSDYGNDVATVLNASRDTAAGLLITDPTASSPGGGPGTHDTLLLKGITKQQLTANQGDIAFHA